MKFKRVKFTKVKPKPLEPRYPHPVEWHELIGFVDEWDIYVAPLLEPVIFVNNGEDYYSCYPRWSEDELMKRIWNCFMKSKYAN